MIRIGAGSTAWSLAALACFCILTEPAAAEPAQSAQTGAAAQPAATPAAAEIPAAPGNTAPASAPANAATNAATAAPADAGSESPLGATSEAANKTETKPAGDAPKETSALPDANAPNSSAAPANAAASPATQPASAQSTTTPAANAAPVTATAPSTTVPEVVQTDPVVAAIRARLSTGAEIAGAYKDQISALQAFYADRPSPLWLKDGALTTKAKAAISEIKRADDYGLDASKFDTPALADGADAAAQADAELKLDIAALKYADAARGGRINPLSLSNILDMKPPVKAPEDVLKDLASAAEADVYLRDQNPHHPQFEALRQALLKARGPKEEVVDEALQVKIPDGKLLRPGDEDPIVELVRKRLKAEAQPDGSPEVYDAALELAVKAFQSENGLRPDGMIGAGTRRVMNNEGHREKADPKRQIERIIANMERWRWLPRDLGAVYVMNNIPEFKSRIMRGEEELLEQKMIVGQPSWPTPIMAAEMKTIVFQPTWGVPDGIKMKELLPRLKRASANSNNFFDQLFGGGESGGGRVLRAYKLQPSLNGRPIDPDSVNWNNVDIRRYSFVQPPGAANPLGQVKFMFPNRHDVYMHDTPQRNLFGQTFRALSHGCMRLDEPRRTAEVLLGHDKGWSAEKVDNMYDRSTNTVALDKPIPVYLTYFTLMVSKDGKLNYFSDIYGHDQRVSSALAGRPVRYTAPEPEDDLVASSAPSAQSAKKRTQKTASRKEPAKKSAGDIFADSLLGLLAN